MDLLQVFFVFFLGAFLASNMPSMQKFFSLIELKRGFLKGLKIGEDMKKSKDRK